MVVGKPAQTGTAELAQERLLVEAAQKDPIKFGEIYERYFYVVYAYVARRVSDRSTAEDLTADVFQKALEFLPRYVWRGVPFAAWLLRIATNIIVDRSKRAAREHELTDQEDASEIGEFSLEELEQRARLFRLVDQLPADQRRVIAMRFADEKSIRDIAAELGRSEGAVKQLQFRGLQTLRAEFQSEQGSLVSKNG